MKRSERTLRHASVKLWIAGIFASCSVFTVACIITSNDPKAYCGTVIAIVSIYLALINASAALRLFHLSGRESREEYLREVRPRL